MLRGWLDFDDLILKARNLLIDPSIAAWVLYRLDGGIDHILIDEAQDTSPTQWQIVKQLSQEFYAGEGSHGNVKRTIFAVGDKNNPFTLFKAQIPLSSYEYKKNFKNCLKMPPHH